MIGRLYGNPNLQNVTANDVNRIKVWRIVSIRELALTEVLSTLTGHRTRGERVNDVTVETWGWWCRWWWQWWRQRKGCLSLWWVRRNYGDSIEPRNSWAGSVTMAFVKRAVVSMGIAYYANTHQVPSDTNYAAERWWWWIIDYRFQAARRRHRCCSQQKHSHTNTDTTTNIT